MERINLREINEELNGAYVDGIKKYVVDEYGPETIKYYKDYTSLNDPVRYWIECLKKYTRWDSSEDIECRFPWDVYNEEAIINVEELLKGERSLTKNINEIKPYKQIRSKHEGEIARLSISDRGAIPSTEVKSYLQDQVLNAVGLLDDLLEKWERLMHEGRALQSARSAAMSAIMSRNTSHNVGSHVSPRTSVERIMKRLGDDQEEKETVASRLKSRLDDLIQEKADFLAEITTEPLATTKPALFYREVVLPFVENTLFTDNIARNEGVGYDETSYHQGETEKTKTKATGFNALRVRVWIDGDELFATYEGEEQGQSYKYQYPGPSPTPSDQYRGPSDRVDHLPYSTSTPGGEALERNIESELPDIEVALPGPLGECAFYGFLENFIRNVAKHHKSQLDAQDEKNLEVHISISENDKNPEFYTVEVSANLWEATSDSTEKGSFSEKDDFYEKLNGSEGEDGDVGLLGLDIVNEDGSLRREAWGIAELRICANLLRGSADLTPDNLSESLKLVEKDDGKRLAYQFRLMKSKRACIVTQKEFDEYRLQKEGYWIFDSLEALADDLKESESPESFKFVLIDCTDIEAEELSRLEAMLQQLPFRVLLTGTAEEPPSEVDPLVRQQRVLWIQSDDVDQDLEKLRSDSPEAFLSWLWQQWTRHRFLQKNGRQESALLELYFQEEFPGANSTTRWDEMAQKVMESLDHDSLKIRVWQEKDNDAKVIGGSQTADQHVVYDRHTGVHGSLRSSGSTFDGMGKDAYTIIDKNSSDFTKVYNPPFPQGDGEHWSFPWELCEAGLLRVLLIDERVAERSFEPVGEKIKRGTNGEIRTRFDVAWASKVYTCTHLSISGGQRKAVHDALKTRDKKYRDENNCEGVASPYLHVKYDSDGFQYEWKLGNGRSGGGIGSNDDIDMLIIHQGIIENYFLDDDNSKGQEDLLESFRKEVPFVIVDSGRGIPHGLSEDVKFMPFSLIRNYVMGERVAKHSLTRIAMSLIRQPNQERG